MSSKLRLICILGFLSVFTISIGYFFVDSDWDSELPVEVAKKDLPPGTLDLPEVPVEEMFPNQIPKGSTFFNALRAQDVNPVTIQAIVDATKPVYNLAKLHSGVRYRLVFQDPTKTEPPVLDTATEKAITNAQRQVPAEQSGELQMVQFYLSPIEKLTIEKANNAWAAQIIAEEVTLKTVTFSGVVSSSLWNSAVNAGMDPDLISELADIFGWEVDFAREVQLNDRWRLTVEQKQVKNRPIGWGAILAAEYINRGEIHQAALFRLNGEDMGYYTPKGASLKKVFLKSPIRYGRITSTFQRRRFHPVLQIYRAHRGVDYGAPIGTPVRAVGDGRVTFAARSGGGGNVIKVRHNGVYETAYKHLSGYARGIRSGASVQQGQVIGYVGNTGMSTGPHLHFEFYQNGSYIDPLGKKFPSADPVPKEHMATFQTSAQTLLSALPAWAEETTSGEQRVPSNAPTIN